MFGIKNVKNKTGAVILSAVLFGGAVLPVYADNYSDAIEQAQAAEAETEGTLSDVNDRISALESSKGEAEAYLEELSSQMTELTDELTDLQSQYAENQRQIDKTSQQLDNAKKDEQNQRANMELRIQYMYENGSGLNGLTSVFSTGSFSDFLNASTSINELTRYDRKALADYTEVCEDIEKKQSELQDEKKKLEGLTEESNSKKKELADLYSATQEDVLSYTASLDTEKKSQADLLASITDQRNRIAALTESAAEEVARAEAEAEAEKNAEAVQASQLAVMNSASENNAETAETAAGQTSEADSEEGQTNGTDAAASSTAQTSSSSQAAPSASQTSSSSSESVQKTSSSSSYSGQKLTKSAGRISGPSGGETYYNLDMSGVVNIMRNMGNTDKYWVREDGAKMLGDYVMVAANLDVHPRGSIVESSLGQAIVVDTGGFATDHPQNLDIATSW